MEPRDNAPSALIGICVTFAAILISLPAHAGNPYESEERTPSGHIRARYRALERASGLPLTNPPERVIRELEEEHPFGCSDSVFRCPLVLSWRDQKQVESGFAQNARTMAEFFADVVLEEARALDPKTGFMSRELLDRIIIEMGYKGGLDEIRSFWKGRDRRSVRFIVGTDLARDARTGKYVVIEQNMGNVGGMGEPDILMNALLAAHLRATDNKQAHRNVIFHEFDRSLNMLFLFFMHDAFNTQVEDMYRSEVYADDITFEQLKKEYLKTAEAEQNFLAIYAWYATEEGMKKLMSEAPHKESLENLREQISYQKMLPGVTMYGQFLFDVKPQDENQILTGDAIKKELDSAVQRGSNDFWKDYYKKHLVALFNVQDPAHDTDAAFLQELFQTTNIVMARAPGTEILAHKAFLAFAHEMHNFYRTPRQRAHNKPRLLPPRTVILEPEALTWRGRVNEEWFRSKGLDPLRLVIKKGESTQGKDVHILSRMTAEERFKALQSVRRGLQNAIFIAQEEIPFSKLMGATVDIRPIGTFSLRTQNAVVSMPWGRAAKPGQTVHGKTNASLGASELAVTYRDCASLLGWETKEDETFTSR